MFEEGYDSWTLESSPKFKDFFGVTELCQYKSVSCCQEAEKNRRSVRLESL